MTFNGWSLYEDTAPLYNWIQFFATKSTTYTGYLKGRSTDIKNTSLFFYKYI